MRLVEYLQRKRREAHTWPGGKTTLKMMSAFIHGISSVGSFGGAAKDALMNCYAFLTRLREETADAELRSDVDTYAAVIATALKETYNVTVDSPPSA